MIYIYNSDFARSGDAESSKSKDTSHLLALTKKLQDATKQYEKMKGELSRLKQVYSDVEVFIVHLSRYTSRCL